MDTIFAPITSIISGSVITIRISGADYIKIKEKFAINIDFKPRYSHLVNLKINNKILDQVVLTYFKAPFSYTGEDVVELSIHGSKFIYQTIIKALGEIDGFRFAQAGEFTKRAVINNKLDLIQAEAIDDLIASETELQAGQALNQLYGNNSKIFANWRSELIKIQSFIEAYIDFPDDEIPDEKIAEANELIKNLRQQIQEKINDNNVGIIIREGIKIAIIGPPNSGKSSLINNLCGRDIAIVSDISGTTRDAIETHFNIAGFAVSLTDTAGIRDTDDVIEKIGIEKSFENAHNADFRILLLSVPKLEQQEIEKFDLLQFFSEKIAEYQEFLTDNTIIVINKIDLLSSEINRQSVKIEERYFNDIKKLQAQYDNISLVAVKENYGVGDLVKTLSKLITENYNKTDSIITRERHKKIMYDIMQIMVNIDFYEELEITSEKLRIIANHLGKIVGNIDIEEILDNIFANFCIGK